LARFLAAQHKFSEALPRFERAVELSGGNEPLSLEMLAAVYAELGRFPEAAQAASRALAVATNQNDAALVQELRGRLAYYESQGVTAPGKP
jgi:Flp pilus assembly protein TadD